MNTPDPNPRAATPSTSTKTILVAAAVVVALLLIVYLWGQSQTRERLSAQEADYQQRIVAVEKRLQTTQEELVAATNRNRLLMARTDLYRAAADLDQRNFGTANTRLQEAAAALAKVDPSSGDIDAKQLGDLRASIAKTNINVATDLQQQRNRVLELAAQLDALVLDGSGTAAGQ